MRWSVVALCIAACSDSDDTLTADDCTTGQVFATACAEGGLVLGGACLHGVCG